MFFFIQNNILLSPEHKELIRYIAISLIILYVILDLVLFLYPQITLKRAIEEGKTITIDALEEVYELRRFQYLSILNSDENGKKEFLWNEINHLREMIQEIEKILVWPYNYKQLFGILSSSMVPIITFIFSNFVPI